MLELNLRLLIIDGVSFLNIGFFMVKQKEELGVLMFSLLGMVVFLIFIEGVGVLMYVEFVKNKKGYSMGYICNCGLLFQCIIF